jgi:hypothetical protein
MIKYHVFNQSYYDKVCLPYPALTCTYGGWIELVSNFGGYIFCCQSQNMSIRFTHSGGWDPCGQMGTDAAWNLSLDTSPKASVLTVMIADASGSTLFVQHTNSTSNTIAGSWVACY